MDLPVDDCDIESDTDREPDSDSDEHGSIFSDDGGYDTDEEWARWSLAIRMARLHPNGTIEESN